MRENELHVAEAVMRGSLPDAYALASLLGERQSVVHIATANHLGDCLSLQRAVLRVVVGRLLRVSPEDVDVSDIDAALITRATLAEAGTDFHSMPALTLDELTIFGAVMRGEQVQYSDLGVLFGYAPGTLRRVLDLEPDQDTLRDVVTVVLTLRLTGHRVDLREIAAALYAVRSHDYKQAVASGEIRP